MWTKRLVTLFLMVVLLPVVGVSPAVAMSVTAVAHPMPRRVAAPSVADFLQPDGTLDLPTGFAGSLTPLPSGTPLPAPRASAVGVLDASQGVFVGSGWTDNTPQNSVFRGHIETSTPTRTPIVSGARSYLPHVRFAFTPTPTPRNTNTPTHTPTRTPTPTFTPTTTPTSTPRPARLTRVSVSSQGEQGNGRSQLGTISANGQYVAFASIADNLAPNSPGRWNVLLHDRQNGHLTLVSVNSFGQPASGDSGGDHDFNFGLALSANAQVIAFGSVATNLAPPLPGTCDWVGVSICPDIFVRDMVSGLTEQESVTWDGRQPNHESMPATISADGRFVVFVSWATNLVVNDQNDSGDVFLVDRLTNQIERVSIASNGIEGNWYSSGNISISASGRFVAFMSNATNLVSGDTNNVGDVFVRDRWNYRTTRISVASSGLQANGRSDNPVISSDGRYVVFASLANNLVPGDTNNVSDVFLIDIQTMQIERVSVGQSGAQGNGSSGNISWFHGRPSYSVSADGRYVTFASNASNLVLGDNNNRSDIFVRDRQMGYTERINVTNNGVEANDGSWDPVISGDGRFVVFTSAANNLVPGDTNQHYDIFVYDRCQNGGCEEYLPGVQP